jgi:hypothetical protein
LWFNRRLFSDLVPVDAVPEPDNFITGRTSDFDTFISYFLAAGNQFLTIGTKKFFTIYSHYKFLKRALFNQAPAY